MTNDFLSLHSQALSFSEALRSNEKSLIGLLMPIEKTRGYLDLGYSSLFTYCVGALKLSESQSYSFIAIARKSEQVPELNLAVQNDDISVSNARRIVSVIEPSNKGEWLKKAAELSQRQLEREVVRENPEKMIRERVRPVAENLSELRMGISPEVEAKLKRAREIAGKGDLLDEVLSFYLKHKDPLEKAKRKRLCPGTVKKVVITRAIPKRVEHAVNLRDERRCQFRARDGKVCGEKAWVQLHHIRPWGRGGGHSTQNLTTLCTAHHRRTHIETKSQGGTANTRR